MEAEVYENGAASANDAGYEHDPPAEYGAPQPLNPRQQQLDPQQFQAALQRLDEWEQYGADRAAYDADQQDYQAQQQERQTAEQVQAKIALADYQVDQRLAAAKAKAQEKSEYDPTGAISDLAQAAKQHQDYYRKQRTNIITTLEQRRQADADRYAIPAFASYHGQQHELDDQAVQVLMNLPPNQIPAIAQVLGVTTKQLKETRSELQKIQRTHQQQQQATGGAHTPPAYRNAPSNRNPEPGSREQLRGALQELFPDMYQ